MWMERKVHSRRSCPWSRGSIGPGQSLQGLVRKACSGRRKIGTERRSYGARHSSTLELRPCPAAPTCRGDEQVRQAIAGRRDDEQFWWCTLGHVDRHRHNRAGLSPSRQLRPAGRRGRPPPPGVRAGQSRRSRPGNAGREPAAGAPACWSPDSGWRDRARLGGLVRS